MSSRNGTLKVIVGVCISAIVLVLIALFNFSNQKSSQALETAIQNRERISIVETKFDEIKVRIDEQREDSKEIKATLSDMKLDIQTLINRR